jgi:hypothetical protein
MSVTVGWEWTGTFDNSANNSGNPEVRYGHQNWEEMMIGFFDVAVDPGADKNAFFARWCTRGPAGAESIGSACCSMIWRRRRRPLWRAEPNSQSP